MSRYPTPTPNPNFYQHQANGNSRPSPALAPVPPQLRQSVLNNKNESNNHSNNFVHPQSGRPPLPPLPPSQYRAQVAAEQHGSSLPVPFAPPTADNLGFQPNHFHPQGQGPQSYQGGPPNRAPSVANRTGNGYLAGPPPNRAPSMGARPENGYSPALHAPPPPMLSRTPSYQLPQPQLHYPQPQHLPPLPPSPANRQTFSRTEDVHQAFQSLSVTTNSSASASRSVSPSSTSKPISVPVVDLDHLTHSYQLHFKLSPNPQQQLKWAGKVIKFIERSQSDPQPASTPSSNVSGSNPPNRISEPVLVQYTDIALRTVLKLASNYDPSLTPPQGGTKILIPESVYLRGDLSSTGAFPTYQPKDPKMAFRDFETAAQLGYHLAWFRIGREYEVCEEWGHALSAYEHGQGLNECACTYRLGMCYLLGQINLEVDLPKAVGYLKSAAYLADETTPQPAYIYGMLLAEEFEALPTIPPEILQPNMNEAQQLIKRSAYLGFAAAQYKLGWCYEYSQMNCPFDPLLSVEYYSLASKQGESEADMALSKWFLCGAEGFFRPNENLAFTFAEKAAKKGLGPAMFAIGYYLEVGIGGEQDGKKALEWYQKALEETGNEDARERLSKLSEGGEMLSRGEHEVHLNQKLVRKHTIAKEKNPSSIPELVSGMRRRETMRRVEEARKVAEMGMMASSEVGKPSNELGGVGLHSGQPFSDPGRVGSPSLSSSTRAPSPGFRTTPMGSPDERLRAHNSSRLAPKRSQPQLRPSATMNSRPQHHGGGYQLSDNGPIQPPMPQSIVVDSANNQRRVNSGGNPEKRAEKVQFNSFADMGIQTAKAKKSGEDCIIA